MLSVWEDHPSFGVLGVRMKQNKVKHGVKGCRAGNLRAKISALTCTEMWLISPIQRPVHSLKGRMGFHPGVQQENKQKGWKTRVLNHLREHGAIPAAAEPVMTWLPRSQMLASEECVFHKLVPLLLTHSNMSEEAAGECRLVSLPISCQLCRIPDTCTNTCFHQK